MQPGDEVFGDLSGCGFGAVADYVCVPQNALILKPTNLSFDEAAAVPAAALTALQSLRNKGQIQPEQKVLINGASGGVGTFAMQIAKSFGAEVTWVCGTRNLDMVRSIGADHVIDYAKADFTKNGQNYDLMFDAAAYRSPVDYWRVLLPKGIYVLIGGSTPRFFQTMILRPWMSMIGGKKMGSMGMKPNQADLIILKNLIEAGTAAPVIDRRHKLTEVPLAIRYLEEGHARGKVVITV